jgi:hypothetical protein
MDKYYYVVCKNLRDTIPKLIGNFLIKASQNDLQFVLFNSVCQSEEIVQKFSESKAIVSERDSLEKMIRVLRQAEKKLMSDPNLATSVYRDDSKDIYDTICQKNTEFISCTIISLKPKISHQKPTPDQHGHPTAPRGPPISECQPPERPLQLQPVPAHQRPLQAKAATRDEPRAPTSRRVPDQRHPNPK